MTLPASFKQLFRNYRFETLSPDMASEMIIRTTLGYGTWEQIEWLFEYYGCTQVRAVFLDDLYGRQELPEPTRRLWRLAFLEEGFKEPKSGPLARWRCQRSERVDGGIL